MSNAALDYITQAKAILDRIEARQMDAIENAAEICAQAIAGDGLVHLFGTGHSRIFIEEMFATEVSQAFIPSLNFRLHSITLSSVPMGSVRRCSLNMLKALVR